MSNAAIAAAAASDDDDDDDGNLISLHQVIQFIQLSYSVRIPSQDILELINEI